MKKIRIQPTEQRGGVWPYPYFIEENGNVGRQDFWKGKPEKLLGFSSKPEAGDISLNLEGFWKNPEAAIGMYPVFADKADKWVTNTIPVESVEILDLPKGGE